MLLNPPGEALPRLATGSDLMTSCALKTSAFILFVSEKKTPFLVLKMQTFVGNA